MKIIDNDLLSMQEARVLVENAREAQKILMTFSQEKLDEIVEGMLEEIEKHSCELAKMSCEETDYGKWEDKYIKNRFVCKYLSNSLSTMKCVGIIKEDKDNRPMEVGVPFGVIIALCPATSPVSTTIYKALIAIKSGNAIIFSPHPRAKNTMFKTLDILIKAAKNHGLPEGALGYLHYLAFSGTKELINHKDTSLVMNTGVPSMLETIYKSGKKMIYGGTGHGPAFIERTANIKQAVNDIITSKSFDNGVVSGAEQSVVVDSCVDLEVKCEFEKNGAYFMSESEAEKLGSLLFSYDGSQDSEIIGKTAKELAKLSGFSVQDNVKILIAERKYVFRDDPYCKEKQVPVLAYYREDDWMHACEKCIELLLSEKTGHTLVIHSNDEEVIKQFILKKPVGRVLVNTPAVFGSMGATTNLFPSMTLGSGSAGYGMTSDNVSPMNLIYRRKVGYGVKSSDEFLNTINEENELDIKQLKSILESFIKELM